MKCDDLSTGIINILDTMLTNDELIKLVHYNSVMPLEEAALTPEQKNSLVLTKFFPYNVGEDIADEKQNEIRVFLPYGEFKSKEILGNILVIQIIVHRDNLLIKRDIGGVIHKRLRTYEILNELVNLFINKSLDKVGIIHFKSYKQIDLGLSDYSCFEIVGDLAVIG